MVLGYYPPPSTPPYGRSLYPLKTQKQNSFAAHVGAAHHTGTRPPLESDTEGKQLDIMMIELTKYLFWIFTSLPIRDGTYYD